MSYLEKIFTAEYSYFTEKFICQVVTWLFKLR
jgi:hypothetical protein